MTENTYIDFKAIYSPIESRQPTNKKTPKAPQKKPVNGNLGNRFSVCWVHFCIFEIPQFIPYIYIFVLVNTGFLLFSLEFFWILIFFRAKKFRKFRGNLIVARVPGCLKVARLIVARVAVIVADQKIDYFFIKNLPFLVSSRLGKDGINLPVVLHTWLPKSLHLPSLADCLPPESD